LTKKQLPLILVTNDDGIASLGLLAAVRCVLDLGEVWAVAPLVQQSGQSRSMPNGDPMANEGTLTVDGAQVHAIAFDTSPAKAVRHGLLRFLPRLPDLAISGINYGENLGNCITISGTVCAAIEAASFGIPALAASLETESKYHFSNSADIDFTAAASFVRRLAQHVLARGMPPGVDLLKLDVPRNATPDTPCRTTRVSRQPYFVSPVTVDEQGRKTVHGYAKAVDLETLEPDSDIYAVAVDRVVSISPMTIDLTALVDMPRLQRLLTLADESRV